jgi:2-keto-4-pentenoate hydratase/2-oxohepta-3-ene-1,7-dioic acid hydratase in catechol pathway
MSQEPVRFVRLVFEGREVWGVLDGGSVQVIEGGPYGCWEPRAEAGPLDSVELLVPAKPTKIVCIGRNYQAHAAELDSEVPAEPLLFLKPPSSLLPHGETIVLPRQSQRVDHEAELALVIGKRCRNLRVDEAWNCALGVTCGNDVTARDLQRRDEQWTRAKGFDTFCPLGPVLVTGISQEYVRDVTVVCRVNGEVRQRGRTSSMVFSAAELIAFASSFMTLEPGDVLMTGTPAGVGPLTPGDVVEVEVEGVGVLRNLVIGGEG